MLFVPELTCNILARDPQENCTRSHKCCDRRYKSLAEMKNVFKVDDVKISIVLNSESFGDSNI